MNSHFKRPFKIYLALCLILNPAIGFSVRTVSGESRCEQIFINSSSAENLVWGLKFLRQPGEFVSKKHPTTIGIEVEGTLPTDWTYQEVAEKIAEVLRLHPEFQNIKIINSNAVDSHPFFYIIFQYKNNEYKYVVTRDASIVAGVHRQGMEINSPILRHAEDFETFNSVLEVLKKDLQFTAAPQSAGIHIHVGFPEATPQELAFLAQLFSGVEEQTTTYFQMMSSRRFYTKPTEEALKRYLQDISSDLVTIKDLMIAQGSRYHALNLHSLSKYGTVEFRLFNSTVEASQVEAYINFSRGLVEAARSQDPRLITYLKESQYQDHLDLVVLAKVLNLEIGDPETFYKNVEPFQRMIRTGRGQQAVQPQLAQSFWRKENLAEFARVLLLSQLFGAIAYQITGEHSEDK